MPMKRSKTDRDIIEATGKVVRRHRKAHRLSQMAVAAAMGISYQQLQKYEKGASTVSLVRLLQLARVLDADPLELMREIMEEGGFARRKPGRPPKAARDPLKTVQKDLQNIVDRIGRLTSRT